jgi:hypothetical protein
LASFYSTSRIKTRDLAMTCLVLSIPRRKSAMESNGGDAGIAKRVLRTFIPRFPGRHLQGERAAAPFRAMFLSASSWRLRAGALEAISRCAGERRGVARDR